MLLRALFKIITNIFLYTVFGIVYLAFGYCWYSYTPSNLRLKSSNNNRGEFYFLTSKLAKLAANGFHYLNICSVLVFECDIHYFCINNHKNC